MKKELKGEESNAISAKVKEGQFGSIDTGDLELWIHKNLSRPDEMERAKFELNKRLMFATIKQMEKTAKWQRIMAIGTILLAIVTFILAIITACF